MRRYMSSIFTCFNTQPPEGGWMDNAVIAQHYGRFNTQPPEGGWGEHVGVAQEFDVSTHSRLKAAGSCCHNKGMGRTFQHTAA